MQLQGPLSQWPSPFRELAIEIRKDWWKKVAAATALMLAGIVVAVWLCWSKPPFLLLALPLFLAGWTWMMWLWSQRDPRQHAILHLLLQKPDYIVWVYTLETQVMPYGFYSYRKGMIYFHTLSGEQYELPLRADQLVRISKQLNFVLPKATFGYSEEKQSQFEVAPQLLLREKNDT